MGLNPVMVGAGVMVTVNSALLTPMPSGVVTVMTPEPIDALGTTARSCVAVLPDRVVVAAPLNVTLVALLRFCPTILTVVPADPLVGEKAEIVGGGPTTTRLAVGDFPEPIPLSTTTGSIPIASITPAGMRQLIV